MFGFADDDGFFDSFHINQRKKEEAFSTSG
jgi:hypothetical protein